MKYNFSEVQVKNLQGQQVEKLHEVLFSGSEAHNPSSHPLISQVRVPSLSPDSLHILERPVFTDSNNSAFNGVTRQKHEAFVS